MRPRNPLQNYIQTFGKLLFQKVPSRSLIAGILTFIILHIIGSPLIQPTTCNDGWPSPSIGKQGACSHHGGVGTNWTAILVLVVSLCGALTIYSISTKKEDAKTRKQKEEYLLRKEENKFTQKIISPTKVEIHIALHRAIFEKKDIFIKYVNNGEISERRITPQRIYKQEKE